VVNVATRAFPQLPASVAERTLPQMLDAAVAAVPDRVALIAHSLVTGGEVSLTYAELGEQARRFAAVLRDRGVGPGDRVAIMIANDGAAEAHIAYHGIHYLGAIAVPINTFYVQREFEYAMAFVEPRALVFASQFAEIVRALTVADGPPALIETAAEPRLGERFGELLWTAPERPAPDASAEADDADWIFTSGTTGHPKAVALSHGSSVACGHEAREVWGLDDESVFQNSSPFFTSTGCHTNLLACLAARCTFIVDPEVDAQAIIERAARHGTTSMFTLTAILAILFRRLDDGRLASLDVPRLKRLVYGGQTMPRAFHERVQDEFTVKRGVGLAICYGLTDGGTSGVMLDPEDHAEAVRRHRTYGMPIGRRGWNEWVEHRIVGEDGRDTPAEEVGEIWLRAPSVMSRYVGNEEATARSLADGWLHTGDMALHDEDGFIFYVDRSKSMIRRGGMNIAAAEVEAVVLSHPAVAEAAVIGRPNPVLGEDVHAVVVVGGDHDVSADELIAHCRDQLADYKVPRSVSFTDALPRNPMGKVARGELSTAETD
jgi:acyl-CoA synthetase (AMP-forming)/AMP-acid ligase II